MKKIIVLLLSAMLIFALSACGSDSDSGSNTENEVKVERDLPEGDYSDTGAGSIYLLNESGSSRDGITPIVYVGEDDVLIQLGLESEGFDGSLLSYIYVDGMEVMTEQLGETQTSIDLSDDCLKAGAHTVEVVQYANNDPASEIVTYKSATYEVKAK